MQSGEMIESFVPDDRFDVVRIWFNADPKIDPGVEERIPMVGWGLVGGYMCACVVDDESLSVETIRPINPGPFSGSPHIVRRGESIDPEIRAQERYESTDAYAIHLVESAAEAKKREQKGTIGAA